MDLADPDRIPWLPLTSADAARLAAQAGNALRQFPWVRAAWLHGSLVRGERPPRDLDFAVLTDRRQLTQREWEQARCAVAEAVGQQPEVIDIRAVDDGGPLFLHNVLRFGVLCCEPDPLARVDFEVRVASLWCEFRPVWEQSRREMLQYWSSGGKPLAEPSAGELSSAVSSEVP